MQFFPNLINRPSYDDLPWQPFREGVEIYPLYKDNAQSIVQSSAENIAENIAESNGASAALLRYQAGAKVPYHSHTGYEHILVLAGSQSDINGTYPKGSLVINPPNTSHQVSSSDGCVVLIIWEKPVIIH